MPHVPPALAQCLQYLQFLQALHGVEPVHVAALATNGEQNNARMVMVSDRDLMCFIC